eukprot:1208561-Prymnesium_polylepis.2
MSRVQLCKDQNDMMKCVWGVQSSFNNDKQTIDLICAPEVENKLREIDAHITNMYNTNLSNTTREYVPLLREASTMRVKLTNDVVLKKIIKNEVEEAQLSDLNHNCECMVIASANNVWLTDSHYGVTFKADIILVKPGVKSTLDINSFILAPGLHF